MMIIFNTFISLVEVENANIWYNSFVELKTLTIMLSGNLIIPQLNL